MADGHKRHTPTLSGTLLARVIHFDESLLFAIGDALTQLSMGWQWLEVGDPVEDVTQAAIAMVDSWYGNTMIGSVNHFLRSIPAGWLELNGATYLAADFPELFEVLDVTFKNIPGGEFTLPDFSNRVLVGSGDSYSVGDLGGLAAVALSVAELPSHSHNYQSVIVDVDLELAGAPDVAAARIGPIAATTSTGSNDAHENMPPFLAAKAAIFAGREAP